jgi:hypothetical protein
MAIRAKVIESENFFMMTHLLFVMLSALRRPSKHHCTCPSAAIEGRSRRGAKSRVPGA